MRIYVKVLVHGIVGAPLLAASVMAWANQAEPIVIGQSLPLTGPSRESAVRVESGAKAYIDRVNALGGVNGRSLELVTLDDGGDVGRHSNNLRALVKNNKAVVVVNCLGERSCLAASGVAAELGVPLLGPMSGAPALHLPSAGHVFSIRPPYLREATVLALQLKTLGTARVTLLTDGAEPIKETALSAALAQAGIEIARVQAGQGVEAMESALRQASSLSAQAMVLLVDDASVAILPQTTVGARQGVPNLLATISSASQTQLMKIFRDRAIGYTSVVPSPEGLKIKLVRELQRDAEDFVGPEAITFEGLESYINLYICAEAIRRTGAVVNASRLQGTLANFGAWDLGGFRVEFGRRVGYASDLVDVGVRTRGGQLRR